MRKRTMKGSSLRGLALTAIVAGLVAVCLACGGCTTSSQASSAGSSSSSTEEAVAEDVPSVDNVNLVADGDPITVFAAKTAAFELNGEENVCYSPTSYYMALAMVAAGANGEAQKQLFNALGIRSTEALIKYCKAQMEAMADAGEESTIDVSNSLWSNVGYTFQAEYQEVVKKYFDAGAFDVEFGTQQTDNMITEWISEETRGLLEPVIATNEADIATLINTIYFKDIWMEPFTEGATASEIFHAKDGDVETDFMHVTTDFGTYIQGEGFTAAQMPFSGGSLCTFILPDPNVSLNGLLESPKSIGALIEATPNSDAQIQWAVPKFDISSTLDNLVDCAAHLGVTDIFDPTHNNMFRNMIVADTAADMNFYINDAIQETTISLDEFGVEAAAYTMLNVKATGLAPEPTEIVDFVLDRPFAYIITAPNNAPLFMGVVANPSAS